MDDTCPVNPYTNEHYWLNVDAFLVCMFCEAEQPIRSVETVEVKGGIL
jgi:hypothetical protein